ncbi:MAG: hypothetical protein J5742_00665 [Alphaproteobacteria bacterium]|nr:hypothetical protein [Alphaproteobacteria bacterium]
MKKISKYFMMATVSLSMFAQNAFAAGNDSGICELINKLGPVIKTLRTLAFLGAAFVLMDWAWGYIKSGKVEKDDLKDKGIAMFVGFFLLFGVAIVLSFVASTGGQEYLGCVKNAFAAGK